MNFKTTLILLIVLAGLGTYLYFTGGRGETKSKTETAESNEQKLFEVKPEDVTKVTIAPLQGKRTVLEKNDGKWRLSEPVSAPAEAFEVDSLVRALTDLKSHGRLTDSSESASATGLASPRFKVEFSTGDNKTHLLTVGNKSAVGDNLYVTASDTKQTQVVGTDILDRLEKPASAYRNPKLVNITTPDVRQFTITRADATIKVEKSGDQWRVTEPRAMPADSSEVEDVLSAVTNLRATDWVAEDQKDARQYQLDNPRVTVTLSSTTQPTTRAATQPSMTTVKFGRYDDILRKNVLVASSDTPAVAKVAASVIDTLNKKPIELRDKKVAQINPDQVSTIVIASDIPATTQPTTKPASKSQLTIKRNVPTLPVGIAAPTTQATTKASTKPATQSAVAASQPATKWETVAAGGEPKPASDEKVDDLLFQLNPLRADRYLESNPTTQPSPTYTVTITTQGPGGATPQQQTLTIVDPGERKNPIATFNDFTFEVSRALIDKLAGDFTKSAANVVNSPPNPAFPEDSR